MLRTHDNEILRRQEAELPDEEVLEILDLSEQDEGEETAATQDLALMRENADAHLTAAIAGYVIRSPGDEATVKIVLPHLCRCSWCRGTLHEALSLCGTETSHPAFSLLAQAEDWARWEAAGRQATEAARQHLHSHGGNVVYERDGAIWEEHPDGTKVRVADHKSSEAASS